MLPIVGGRRSQQIVPAQFLPRCPIKLPDDEEMREARDVGEPRLKLRQDLEHTIHIVFGPKPLGNLLVSLYGLITNPIGCEVNIRDLVSTSHTNAREQPKENLCPIESWKRYGGEAIGFYCLFWPMAAIII